jgi:fluoroquinolone transport system permease protein
MKQIIYFQNDLKQVFRDAITGALLFAPILLITFFKLITLFLVPVLFQKTGFDLTLYYNYVFSVILVLSSGMLGIVSGFQMIDDRDGNITELMAVTPLGRSGYLFNRMLLTGVFSFIYAVLAYWILDLVNQELFRVLFLAVMQSIYTGIIGLLLYFGADDKVKGLTYAKALNILMLFTLTDLIGIQWLIVLSWLCPTYWISQIVIHNSISDILICFAVHVIWLGVLIYGYFRSTKN